MKNLVAQHAQDIASHRGQVVAGYRTRTVVPSLNANYHFGQIGHYRLCFTEVVRKECVRVGVVQNVVSSFVNCVLDNNPTFETCQFLTDQMFLGQLWTRLIPKQGAQNTVERLADLPSMNLPRKTILENFVDKRWASHDTRYLDSLGSMTSRVKCSSNNEMFKSVSAHLADIPSIERTWSHQSVHSVHTDAVHRGEKEEFTGLEKAEMVSFELPTAEQGETSFISKGRAA